MMAILRILVIGENLSRAGEGLTLRETAVESNLGGNWITQVFPSNHGLCDCGIKAADLISSKHEERTSILHSNFSLLCFPNSEFLLLNFSQGLHHSVL